MTAANGPFSNVRAHSVPGARATTCSSFSNHHDVTLDLNSCDATDATPSSTWSTWWSQLPALSQVLFFVCTLAVLAVGSVLVNQAARYWPEPGRLPSELLIAVLVFGLALVFSAALGLVGFRSRIVLGFCAVVLVALLVAEIILMVHLLRGDLLDANKEARKLWTGMSVDTRRNLEERFQCCGLMNARDLPGGHCAPSLTNSSTTAFPEVSEDSCYRAITQQIHSRSLELFSLGIGIANLLLFTVVLASYRARHLHRQKRHEMSQLHHQRQQERQSRFLRHQFV